MRKVLILQSSDGMNARLSHQIVESLSLQGVESDVIALTELELPLYTPNRGDIPNSVINLLQQIDRSTGIIVVAPEYNGGMPPVLTNAITWVSIIDENWRAAFDGKAIGLATHSGGGGHHLIMAMRQQFSYLGANVMGMHLVTAYQRPLEQEKLTDFVKKFKKVINNEYNLAIMLDDDGHYFDASY